MPEEEYEKIYELGSFSDYVDSQLKESVKFLGKIKTQKEFNKKVEEFYRKRVENEKTKKQEKKIKKILEE